MHRLPDYNYHYEIPEADLEVIAPFLVSGNEAIQVMLVLPLSSCCYIRRLRLFFSI